MRAIEMIEFITKKLLLIKLKGNYWAMLDTDGYIQEIPLDLLQVLNQVPFDSMTSKRLEMRGKMQLMLQSATHTTEILFDQDGQVVTVD